MRWLVPLVLLGCAGDLPQPGSRPVVRASDGGSATLLIIACPPNDVRAMAVGELVDILTRHEGLVVAGSGSTARLTINACPFGSLSLPQATRR